MVEHRGADAAAHGVQDDIVDNDRLVLDNDDDELELYRSVPSPWAEIGEGLEPHPPPSSERRPLGRPTRAPGSTRINVVVNTGKPSRPAVGAGSSSGGGADAHRFLPVLPSASKSPRQMSIAQFERGRDASPVVHAYQALVNQSNVMTASFNENSEQRRMHQAALKLGIAQLSTECVQKQQRAIRFNTLKNEIDIFQQHLDPFIFEMRSAHEHQVHSSVYRHFARMQDVQELGIPIYSLGNYLEDEHDRILTARTTQKFYRRIRRHDAAHYLDTEIIPRPAVPKRKPTTVIATAVDLSDPSDIIRNLRPCE